MFLCTLRWSNLSVQHHQHITHVILLLFTRKVRDVLAQVLTFLVVDVLGDLGPGSVVQMVSLATYLSCGGYTWRSWPRFLPSLWWMYLEILVQVLTFLVVDVLERSWPRFLPSLWWMYLEILVQVLTFLVVDVLGDLGPGSYLLCGGCSWRSWPRFLTSLWWMYLEIMVQVLTFLVVDVLENLVQVLTFFVVDVLGDLGPGSYLPCGGCTWRSWLRFSSTECCLPSLWWMYLQILAQVQ